MILLLEVVGSEGAVAPAQIVRLVPKLKAGTTIGFTTTFLVTDIPHCPVVGVNT